MGLQHGYRAHTPHPAAQGHHIPTREEKLHELGEDACAETETRRGYKTIQQARRRHDEAASHDATLRKIWRQPTRRLSADADTDAYKEQQDKADQKQVITSDDGYVRYINGCDVQIKAKNNKWYGIEVVKTEQLQALLEKEEYAAAKDAIEAELMARSVQP